MGHRLGGTAVDRVTQAAQWCGQYQHRVGHSELRWERCPTPAAAPPLLANRPDDHIVVLRARVIRGHREAREALYDHFDRCLCIFTRDGNSGQAVSRWAEPLD